MIKFKNKKFEVQRKNKCINYNWCEDADKHCAILYSESLDKPLNAFVKYSSCLLDKNVFCKRYGCGVQLIKK